MEDKKSCVNCYWCCNEGDSLICIFGDEMVQVAPQCAEKCSNWRDEKCKKEITKKDNVNHPSHYTQYRIEVIDIIEDATRNLTGIKAVCLANVIKYVLRYQYKNGIEDLKKAKWYLEKLIKEMGD